MTVIAIFLVGGLIFSQMPLFHGIAGDLKYSIGRFSSRSRGNSALKDIGASALIEKMLDCRTSVEMWKLQKKLGVPMLLESEKPRWVIQESSKRQGFCWVVFAGLLKAIGVFLSAVLLSVLLFVIIWVASAYRAGPIVLLVVAIGSGVNMEIYRWKNMVVAGEKISISEFVRNTNGGAGNGEVGDENDGNVEVDEEGGIKLEEVSKKKDGGIVEIDREKHGEGSEKHCTFDNPMRTSDNSMRTSSATL